MPIKQFYMVITKNNKSNFEITPTIYNTVIRKNRFPLSSRYVIFFTKFGENSNYLKLPSFLTIF